LKVVFARAVVIVQISRAFDKDDVVRSTCYGVQTLGSTEKDKTGLKKRGKVKKYKEMNNLLTSCFTFAEKINLHSRKYEHLIA
jgi:hypothetical protein